MERLIDFKPLFVGATISAASYLYGLIDAGPSVRRMERRGPAEVSGFALDPAVYFEGADAVEVGLRLQRLR
jgi:hypothetical protein